MMKNRIKYCALLLVLGAFSPNIWAACPPYLNQPFKKLHSAKTLNICDTYAGKSLLIVNTASHCGYTPQFAGLEKLYKTYKDKGLVVLGFASNDFDQEDKDEKKIADVCYINYGVTFDMLSPIHVTGASAHPLFKELANQTRAPAWNFNKYLVSADGKVIKYFDSNVTPESAVMKQALDDLLTVK